jgi:hypothetical protein
MVVSIDERLPGLVPFSKMETDVLIRSISDSKSIPLPPPCSTSSELLGERLWYSVSKMDGGYLLRFNDLGDFFLSNEGKEIVCKPTPKTPPQTIQHLLLDQVIPLAINLSGGEALHASAVRTAQGLIAFSGHTGSGKSTAAGFFLKEGDSLLTDDCLRLIERNRNIYGIPAYPGLRLWGDSLDWLFRNDKTHKPVAHYTVKQRLCIERRHGAYCSKTQPLRRVYVIGHPSDSKVKTDVLIEHLSLQESLMVLLRSAFRLDVEDRLMLMRQFRFLERVVSKVPIQRLIFPRDFNMLPAVREAIVDDLKDLDN